MRIELKCPQCPTTLDMTVDRGQNFPTFRCAECGHEGLHLHQAAEDDRDLFAIFKDQEKRIRRLELLFEALMDEAGLELEEPLGPNV